MKHEQTPFNTIVIKNENGFDSWAKFYWSTNSGQYGHQVITEYCLPSFDAPKKVKTNGCGFCKQADALGTFIVEYFGGYKNLPENHLSIGGYRLDYLAARADLPQGRDQILSHDDFVKMTTN